MTKDDLLKTLAAMQKHLVNTPLLIDGNLAPSTNVSVPTNDLVEIDSAIDWVLVALRNLIEEIEEETE